VAFSLRTGPPDHARVLGDLSGPTVPVPLGHHRQPRQSCLHGRLGGLRGAPGRLVRANWICSTPCVTGWWRDGLLTTHRV